MDTEIEKVIFILERYTSMPFARLDPGYSERWTAIIRGSKTLSRQITWIALILSLLLIAMIPFAGTLARHTLMIIPLAVATIAQLCGALIVILPSVEAIPMVLQLKQRPLGFFFDQLRQTSSADVALLDQLKHCDPEAVRYAAKQYQYHRIAFEKRGGTISGNIDKLGLFPSLATVLLFWNSMHSSTASSWMMMLVPLLLIFHLMNLYAFGLQQKMDRVIAILEYSIASPRPENLASPKLDEPNKMRCKVTVDANPEELAS